MRLLVVDRVIQPPLELSLVHLVRRRIGHDPDDLPTLRPLPRPLPLLGGAHEIDQ
ncbi:hypothetical protein MANAM107_10010 [Actinomyces capricornis]|uniref:Uncharacterized protein n=1 Tax=Actinomyces capricornis TaxID=2755559 RepID=A0ABN6K6C8_9ACTO|nr:hypothetical protein MANAM107_10010 [Actinomyces capricornis]